MSGSERLAESSPFAVPAGISRLMDVWDRNTGPLRVAVVDLRLVWRDTETLLSLQAQATDPDVQAEIAWALAGGGDETNRR